MRFRKTRLRTKITAMLLSLAALWVFAAWVTLREGVNLLWVSQLDSAVSAPSDPLLFALQKERRISMVRLSEKTAQSRKELETQRKQTDRFHAAFRESAASSVVDLALDDQGDERLAEMLKRLESLKDVRKGIDAGRFDQTRTSDAYADVIDPIYGLYGSLATLDDKELAKDVRSLLALSRARELLTREDALLAGALADGRLTPDTLAKLLPGGGLLADHRRTGRDRPARLRPGRLRQADQGAVRRPAAGPGEAGHGLRPERPEPAVHRRGVEVGHRALPDRLQHDGARRR